MTLVLGIESSCDETAIAILRNGHEVLANLISSQVPLHAEYGGVIPEFASRQHLLVLQPLLQQALQEAQVTLEEIDAIAVTRGPGLQGALLIGLMAAKAIAWSLQKPLIGVNHLEGHIYANWLAFPELKAPFLTLLVSGGHTLLIEVADHGVYRTLGRTIDDAVGEAYDKVARLLGLPYPGGPHVDRLAAEGNPKAFHFPRAMLKDNYDFSFSGLKTSVLYAIQKLSDEEREAKKADLAASFQAAVIQTLIRKTIQAAQDRSLPAIALGGGVAANRGLRAGLQTACEEHGLTLYLPDLGYCTDNAAMIACAGYHRWRRGEFDGLNLEVRSRLPLDSP